MNIDSETKQYYIDAFLKEKIDAARESFAKGHRIAAAYMATIAGMWTNACKRPYVNPFTTAEDDVWLYKWFCNGYDDFTQAVGMTIEIRKKQLALDEARDEAIEANKRKSNGNGNGPTYKLSPQKEEKTGFWKKKLW